ncbi:MAG: hypothetical protein AB1505_27700 [Candidatus Latescibacterota bacterium]
MVRTAEAVTDGHGDVRLLEAVQLGASCRALVTIVEGDPVPVVQEAALLSEPALKEDWERPEEDAAWSHLQQAP